MKLSTLNLIFLLSFTSPLFANKIELCDLMLSGEKLEVLEKPMALKKDNALAGVVLEVKDVIKNGFGTEGLKSIEVYLDGETMFDTLEHINGSKLSHLNARPGDYLQIVTGLHKIYNVNLIEVLDLKSGKSGRVWWNYLRLSTKVVARPYNLE